MTVASMASRKGVVTAFVIFMLALPMATMIAWHAQNNRLPNDDAAQYATVAAQIVNNFHDRQDAGAVYGWYRIRGWRTTIFPAMTAPFFALSANDGMAATGIYLTLVYGVLLIYTYLLARLHIDRLASAAVTALVVTLPWLVHYSHVFFSETTMLALVAAALYHLHRSDHWKMVGQSAIAGLMIGVAVALRPEVAVLAAFAVLVYALIGIHRGDLAWRDVFLVAASVGLTLVLFTYRGQNTDQSAAPVVAGLIAGLAAIHIVLRIGPWPFVRGFAVFQLLAIGVVGVWYLPAFEQFLYWVYNASAGVIAGYYPGVGRFGPVGSIAFVFQGIGGLQTAIIAVLTLGVGVMAWRRGIRSLPGAWIAHGGLAALALVIIAIAVGEGSDTRRAFVGGYAFFLGAGIVASWPGLAAIRLRVAVISALALAQAGAGLLIAFDVRLPVRSIAITRLGTVDLSPLRSRDTNAEVLRAVRAHTGDGTRVGTYSLAMDAFAHRLFDRDALNFLSVSRRHHIGFGSAALFDELEDGYRSLSDDFDYILLDRRTDFIEDVPTIRLEGPYMRLTLDLIDRVQKGTIGDVGWRMAGSPPIAGGALIVLSKTGEAPPGPPMLIRSIGTTNIVRHGALYYAVPQSLGAVEWGQEDVAKLPGVMVGDDAAALAARLASGTPPSPSPPSAPPRLLRSVGTYNVVDFDGRVWGVPQSLGEVRWGQDDVAAMAGVVVGDTEEKVLEQLRRRGEQ